MSKRIWGLSRLLRKKSGTAPLPRPAHQPLALGTRLVLAGSLLLVITSAVLRVFDFSHPGDYGEGPVLAMAERMGGEAVSHEWLDRAPYTLSCYGPGYYWVVGAAAAVSPWPRTLIAGRLVSLLATLATAALIGWIVRRHTGRIELALTGALIYLVSPIVHSWATPHRVDPLAVLFATAAYAAITARRGGVVTSAACVVIGSLVKQTVAFCAVPIFLYLLLSARYRAAMTYALVVATGGAAAWFALDRASGGYFLATAIRGNLGSLLPTQGLWASHAFLCTPLATAALLVIGYRFVRRPAAALGSVYCVGFVLSTLIAAALSAKEGAGASYFLEASSLAALVVGCHGLRVLWSADERRTLAVLAILALILVAPEVRFLRQRGFCLHVEPFGRSLVRSRLKAAPDAGILADGQLVPAVLSAGFTPLVNDPFVFRLLVDQGRIEAAPLVEAMKRGDVPYLVLKQSVATHREHVGRTSQKWPVQILDAFEQHFVLDATGKEVFIYRHCRN